MKTINFIFSHGWGMHDNFWEPLIKSISKKNKNAQFYRLNRKYFKNKLQDYTILPFDSLQLKDSQNTVFIGHSFGFYRVLQTLKQQSIQPMAIISLNGFLRFCQLEGFKTGSKTKMIQRMINEIKLGQENAKYCFEKYYNNNEFICPWEIDTQSIDTQMLIEDLEQIKIMNEAYSFDSKLIAIHGNLDKVVPLNLVEDFYKDIQNISLFIKSQANHTLGYSYAQEVSEIIFDNL